MFFMTIFHDNVPSALCNTWGFSQEIELLGLYGVSYWLVQNLLEMFLKGFLFCWQVLEI